MTLTVIDTPIGALTNRAHVEARVLAAWPTQPPSIRVFLTAALTSRHATAEACLWLADALGEAASHAGSGGHLAVQSGLTALRHLMQDAAHDRPVMFPAPVKDAT